MTSSPAEGRSSYSTTTSVRMYMPGMRMSSTSVAVTHVLSVPTSARATLKPRSGSSSSRLNPETRRGSSLTGLKRARMRSA